MNFIQQANKAVKHLISSYNWYWKRKQQSVLIKNSKGGGGGSGGKKGGGEKSHSHKQSEGLGGVLWVYKVGLECPVTAMAISPKPNT